MGLKTVLVINKIDRQDARAKEVLDLVYSLYIDLGADDTQLEFPVLYTVARQGQASTQLEVPGKTLEPLFDAILEPHPAAARAGEADDAAAAGGQPGLRRLRGPPRGGPRAGGPASRRTCPSPSCARAARSQQGKIVKLYGFQGLKRAEIADAGPGEIVSIAGIEEISIGDTIADPEKPGGPAAHHRGRAHDDDDLQGQRRAARGQGRQVRHLAATCASACTARPTATWPSAWRTPRRRTRSGWWAAASSQLAVIIETMRREGYELTASNPEPITKTVDGAGPRADGAAGLRRAREQRGRGDRAPGAPQGPHDGHDAAGLGPHPARSSASRRAASSASASEFLTITRGEGIMSSQFDGYEPWFGYIPKRSNGAIVSDRAGRHGALRAVQHPGARRSSSSARASRCTRG